MPFYLFCTPLQENKIKEILHQKFQNNYPQMQINAIDLKPASNLGNRFSDYQVKSVSITKDNLKRAKGSIMITLHKGDKIRKTYYKYKIKATIPLYISAATIQKGRIITPDIAQHTEIPFTTLYHKPIDYSDFYHYVAKRTIRENQILSFEKLKRTTDIQRNDEVTAIIKDGGLQLQFRAKAMQDGNTGDIIRIKKDYKKSFKARILSNTTVEVVE
jgi:flagella basal body P-ring formation protein FlgA